MSVVTIAFFGDLVGSPGRKLLEKHLPLLKAEHSIDVVIANGENCAHGKGITPPIAQELFAMGVDVITSGNHIWDKKEIIPFLYKNDRLLRPLNYPVECPGKGTVIIEYAGIKIGVINALGRVFMNTHSDCPFKATYNAVCELKKITPLIVVDFHAETTSEKLGLAFYLDGHVSAVVGTHTHVQTADERILPGGTAYITDLGMAGSLNSMLGVTIEPLIQKFLTQMPVQHVVAMTPPFVISGVVVTIDTQTGKAESIKRFFIVDDSATI